MPLIFDDAAALMRAPRARFRYVREPFYVHSDFPWQSGVAIWAQNVDFIADYEAQCIYPQPVAVYHDQGAGYGYSGGGGAALGWVNIGDIPFSFRNNDPHGFQEFHLKQTPEDADFPLFAAETSVDTQGVTFLWSRYDQKLDDSGVPDIQKFTTFRIGVGAGVDQVLYSVRYLGQGDVSVAKSYDGGITWNPTEAVRQKAEYGAAWGVGDPEPGASSSEEGSDAPTEMNYLEFRLIAGRLMLWTGSGGPYVFDEARVGQGGAPIATINYLAIRAYKFVAFSASAHPTKWKPQCIYDSPEIPIGFYSENVDDPYIDPAGPVPFGWDAYVDYPNSFLFGPICQYRLVLQGPVNGTYKGQQFSDYAAAVRCVNLFWLSREDFNPAAPLNTAPEEIVVTHAFDINSLQITSGGYCRYNNNRARFLPTGQFGTWGEWVRAYGQVAMDVLMNRTTPTGAWGPAQLVFSGYANTQGTVQAEVDGSYATLFLADRSRQLRQPRFALPWMDGWNVFYAMAYLAQLGGVSISEMKFAPWVPNIPFGPGSDLGSPDGSPAYYLPVGDAGSVVSRPQSGANLWDVMTKIAYSIGYMLFFDAEGALQFRKFIMPLGTKRSFFESDRASAIFQPGGGYEGCWSMSVTKDMDEVRSTSIVIGINAFGPRYDPIVYKWTDFDAIDNPNAFNHLGYDAPAVWMDSQFADPYFAYIASGAMFYFLRTPGYAVEFETWLQPDIFPLDMIQLQSPKLGTYGVRFMVTSVRHRVNKSGGSSVITARYIP